MLEMVLADGDSWMLWQPGPSGASLTRASPPDWTSAIKPGSRFILLRRATSLPTGPPYISE